MRILFFVVGIALSLSMVGKANAACDLLIQKERAQAEAVKFAQAKTQSATAGTWYFDFEASNEASNVNYVVVTNKDAPSQRGLFRVQISGDCSVLKVEESQNAKLLAYILKYQN